MSHQRRILIMGLPGAGKTTLAKVLAKRLNAVHFEADEVRRHINSHLGFSLADRVEQARRMGWMCEQVTNSGHYAIADFVCPTRETRDAFGPSFVVWVARIEEGRFADTNAMFETPDHFDLQVTAEGQPEAWAEKIAQLLEPVFNPQAPTALFLGRYQPFHDGHRALILEGIKRVGQACVAVRNTAGLDAKNPFPFEPVRARIEAGLVDQRGRFIVIPVPNLTNIFYGRDVGYAIEQIDLDMSLQEISATDMRRRMGMPANA